MNTVVYGEYIDLNSTAFSSYTKADALTSHVIEQGLC